MGAENPGSEDFTQYDYVPPAVAAKIAAKRSLEVSIIFDIFDF